MLASLLASCDLRPPHVQVTIQDRIGLAKTARELAIGSDREQLTIVPVPTPEFPLTVVVSSDVEGEQRIWIDALGQDGAVLARGSSVLMFEKGKRGETAEIDLLKACDRTEQCDDAVWCNGSEVCSQLLTCTREPEPCPPAVVECGRVSCDEANRRCACAFEGAQEIEPNDLATSATLVTLTSSATRVLGAISSKTDVDIYAIDVAAGRHLEAFVSIPGFDDCVTRDVVDLVLIGTDGLTQLASSGTERRKPSCGRISPRTTPAAFRMAAGRYYVAVLPVREIMNYFLNLRVVEPGCGNSIRDEGETCDDGNRIEGDGCSKTCAFEIASTIAAPGGRVPLELGSSEVSRVVRLGIGAGQSITATVTDGQGGCASGTGIELLDPDGTVLGAVEERGEARCAAIHYPADAFARDLRAGTYWLVVYSRPDTFGRLNVELDVRLIEPRCGNGRRERASGEQCDDANTAGGDGCSSRCTLEIGNRLTPPGGRLFLNFPSQDVFRVVEIELTRPGQSITATTTSGPPGDCDVDTEVALLDSSFEVLGGRSDSSFSDRCARVFFPRDRWASDLDEGRYYLVLFNQGFLNGTVEMTVGIIDPRCGDGVTQQLTGEECDDGNAIAGDGCAPGCRFDGMPPKPEEEPNNSLPQAMDAGAAFGRPVTISGRISPSNDLDYYAFQVPAGRTLTFVARTYGRRGDRLSCQGDTVISLLDGSGALIATNDDTFDVGCSTLDGRGPDPEVNALGPGRYFLRVREYSDKVIPGYLLDLELY